MLQMNFQQHYKTSSMSACVVMASVKNASTKPFVKIFLLLTKILVIGDILEENDAD